MMLLKLLSTFGPSVRACVVSLGDAGTIGPRIEALGVPVHALGLRRGRGAIAATWELGARIRAFRPDVIQGWMYHGNLGASIGSLIGGGYPVLWSVRQSLYDLALEKRGTAAVIRTGAIVSRRGPAAIIYNSRVAAKQHEAIGYAAARTTIIPNGFDTEIFSPNPEAGAKLRAELGLDRDTLVVGLVARLHPMKSHATFFRAGASLLAQGRKIQLVLVGRDTDVGNPAMSSIIRASGLSESRVTSLGERRDMESVNSLFDIACSSSSWGEGFPNAIGEAMACEIPCVVTDIGDSADVVGDTGRVVPADDPAALADAIASLHDAGPAERKRLGLAARRRVIERFSLRAVAGQYEALFCRTSEITARRRVA